MKHNEFKALIKKELQLKVSEYKLKVVAVDVYASTKMYYIYDKDYNCKGTLRLFCNSTDMSLEFSSDSEKAVNIAHKDCSCSATYMNFKSVLSFLDTIAVTYFAAAAASAPEEKAI